MELERTRLRELFLKKAAFVHAVFERLRLIEEATPKFIVTNQSTESVYIRAQMYVCVYV